MLPELSTLTIFLIATVSLNVTPGPDMLYVISRSLNQGRKAGVMSALGIGAGTLVHTFIAAVGLSAVLLSVPLLFDLVRYVGAAYLVFLGAHMLLGARQGRGRGPARTETPWNLWDVFKQGIVTNVLNPKVALFFLAFLPQFVDQSKGLVAPQLVSLGLIFDTSGTTVNIIVASLAGRLNEALKARPEISQIQRILPSCMILALGVLLLVK